MKPYLLVSANTNNKVQVIDYLKGFSILTIALMHLFFYMSAIPSKLITLSSIGGTGVHVFFLCSGIGLYMSFLKRPTTYIDFFSKRFFKIYVPYIIVVFVSFLIPWSYNEDDKLTALLSHIFLFKMFIPKYEGSFGEHFWFISTIFQLYILFIPMCWIKSKIKNNKIFVILFTGISITWWILCYILDISSIRIWGSFCLQYIWEFAIGFVLAEKFHKGSEYKLNIFLLLFLAIAGIGLQAGLALFSDSLKIFNDIPALIGYTSLALLLYKIPFIKYICNKLCLFSYEFYLIHILVFVSMFHLLKPNDLLIQCVIGFISIILALILAYFYNIFTQTLISQKHTKTQGKS